MAIVLGPEATRAWELAGSRVFRFGTRIITTRLKLLDSTRNPLTIFLVIWGNDTSASLGVSSRDDDPREAGRDRVLGHHGVLRERGNGCTWC